MPAEHREYANLLCGALLKVMDNNVETKEKATFCLAVISSQSTSRAVHYVNEYLYEYK